MQQTPPSFNEFSLTSSRIAEIDTQLSASTEAMKDVSALMSRMMFGRETLNESKVSDEEARTVAQKAISELDTFNSGWEKILSFCGTNLDKEQDSLRSAFTRLQKRVVKEPQLHKSAEQLDPATLLKETKDLNEERRKMDQEGLQGATDYFNRRFNLKGSSAIAGPMDAKKDEAKDAKMDRAEA